MALIIKAIGGTKTYDTKQQWRRKSQNCFYFKRIKSKYTKKPLENKLHHTNHALIQETPSLFVYWLVGSLTSKQQTSVSQEQICKDNCMCSHTEIEIADQTFHLTQSQYTDTRSACPSSDLSTPGAGIMEANDYPVTTVFTVQPSFPHRHSTNRVSWSVAIVGERRGEVGLHVRWRWQHIMILGLSSADGGLMVGLKTVVTWWSLTSMIPAPGAQHRDHWSAQFYVTDMISPGKRSTDPQQQKEKDPQQQKEKDPQIHSSKRKKIHSSKRKKIHRSTAAKGKRSTDPQQQKEKDPQQQKEKDPQIHSKSRNQTQVCCSRSWCLSLQADALVSKRMPCLEADALV